LPSKQETVLNLSEFRSHQKILLVFKVFAVAPGKIYFYLSCFFPYSNKPFDGSI
jgi:hypothetical protein